MLGEKDDSPQLFLPSRVQAARKFAHDKEVEKEQQKKDIEEKKKRAAKEESTRGKREKSTRRCSIYIKNSTTRGSVEGKGIDGAKKADKEAKKAQVTAKALPSQVNKNSPGGVQKSRIYN